MNNKTRPINLKETYENMCVAFCVCIRNVECICTQQRRISSSVFNLRDEFTEYGEK